VSAATILIDLLALLAIVAGALMLLAQERVRHWWAILTGKERGARVERADDPARYALTIFGMMLLAFGIIILAFFTTFALLA
jgi:hypothetical protein